MSLRKYQEAGLEPVFQYKKPKEMKDDGEIDRYHRIELAVEGVPLGYAELQYMSKPIPSFLVDMVFIKKSIRGYGFGGAIMKKINDYIISRGKTGILCNVIEEDQNAHKMYANYGWHESPRFPQRMTINELYRIMNGFHLGPPCGCGFSHPFRVINK